MKRSAADRHTNATDNADLLPTNDAVWLPEHLEDGEGFSWPSTPSSKRVHHATVTVAPEDGLGHAQDQRRAALQDLIRR